MNTISFRIPLGQVGHTRFFLNGSAFSRTGFNKGDMIQVSEKCGKLVAAAEVIQSNHTGRSPDSFLWSIAGNA